MSLAGVIGRYSTGSYAVARAAQGARVNGVYVPATPTTINIDASIQPVTGRVLRDLPEGQNADESVVIFTTTQLLTRTPSSDPDVITIGGEPYRITRVDTFGVISGGHYRAFAERVVQP